MNKKRMLLVFLIIAGFFYIGFFIWKHVSKVIPSRSFTIWWPAYDAFKPGVGKWEKIKQYIQTTFLQKQNIFLVLNELQRGTDASLLPIYGAILATSRAPPVKIIRNIQKMVTLFVYSWLFILFFFYFSEYNKKSIKN